MNMLRTLAATVATWASALAVQAMPPVPPANLTVYSEQGQPFGLVLDGRALTWPMSRQVRTGPLPAGWHQADVSVPSPFGPPQCLRTSLWLEPGRETSYVLVLRRNGPQLRPLAGAGYGGIPAYGGQYGGPGGYGTPPPAYPNNTPYPAPATPGNYPNGNSTDYPPPGNYPNGGSYPNPGNYPNGNGQPTPGNYPGGSGQPVPGSYPNGNGQPAPGNYPGGSGYPTPAPGGGGYYPEGGGYLQPLAPADFGSLQQELARRSFDDERLSIARQALSTSSLRADELAVLMRTLSFDRSRVELAEFGYAHVADPQNFYRVYEALQFSSSIREVQQALGLPQR